MPLVLSRSDHRVVSVLHRPTVLQLDGKAYGDKQRCHSSKATVATKISPIRFNTVDVAS
jgi:hypothetical protein